jgi:hypothetical protein
MDDHAEPLPRDAPNPNWRRDLWAAMALVLLAFSLHAHGLTLGFFFDDNNHLELCKKNGYHDLAGGVRFDWNHRLVHAWWTQKETGWAYFRPLPVVIRTTLLRTFGLDPVPFHILHLALHILTVVLLYALLRRLGCGLWTSLIAGGLFTLHPAHPFATAWVANDGPILIGLWTLLGLWCLHGSARAGHRQVGWLAGVFVFYLLALLTRENGIMLGPMVVLFDLLGAWRLPVAQPGAAPGWRRRVGLYVALASMAVVYLGVRSWCLGPGPLPRRPYFYWPTEPGFLAWLPYKVLSDALAVLAGLPAMPMAEVPWMQARPIATAILVLLLATLLVVIGKPLWRSPVLWGLLAGIALSLAPSVSVFSMGYYLYLATVGWAVLVALGARKCYPAHPRLISAALGLLAVWCLGNWWCGMAMVHGAAAAEHAVVRQVVNSDARHFPADTKLFFIDLPFFAMEVAPAIRLTTDRTDLEVYPLTLAPDLFASRDDVTIQVEDDRTLVLRRKGAGWFCDTLGEQVQLGFFGANRDVMAPGAFAHHPQAGALPFRVEIVQADKHGVQALRFIFDKPLDDPSQRFFARWSDACAQPLLFQRSSDGKLELYLPPDWQTTKEDQRDLARMRRVQTALHRYVDLMTSWPY